MARLPTLRGIHIDPYEHTITEVMIDNTSSKTFLDHCYKLCRTDIVEYVYRESNGRPLHMFVDEEGRIKDPPQHPFAINVDELNGEGEELRGPAIILGEADEDGNTMSAPDWCTVGTITPLVMWAEQSHAEFPEHWLVKILMLGGSAKPQFACTYLNPHEMVKLQDAGSGMSSQELAGIFETKKVMGSVFYSPQDFGFSNKQFEATMKEAGESPLLHGIIMDALDRIRIKIAKEVLKIDPKNLFLMREPVMKNPKPTQGR
jgi:hypothetical protein